MGSAPSYFLKQNSIMLLMVLVILFLCSIPDKGKLCFNHNSATQNVLTKRSAFSIPPFDTHSLEGYFSFENIDHAASDFGNRVHVQPKAVLYPKSVSDISSTIKCIFEMGSSSELTVAARGHGHSLHGQAQAHQGIVINMESLKEQKMRVQSGDLPHVDVSGGELWINVLHETLKHGLAPKSWTDYLHLTVGGTLSNGGIGGQAFRHGPQIDNVYQMEVITGKGEVITCSDKHNAELYYSVLGGLGQIGIISRARISLEPAPKMVKWIRVLYYEFSKFSNDQEYLISSQQSFDYIEGFVIVNRTGLLDSWRSSFTPNDPFQASRFTSEGKTLYCLEVAKYYHSNESGAIDQKIESLLSKLSFIPSTLFMKEATYVDFLDRVHASEIKLQSKGLWDVPHPWLNLMIPKTKINQFVEAVFGNIITDSSNGPILIYPVNKSKWNNRTSLVMPEEATFYLVGFLSSAVPSSTAKDGLEHILNQNQRILNFCSLANLGVKQYLAHYNTQEEWEAHFGLKWDVFVQRKLDYDPLAILAPGQKIFKRRR